MRRILCFALASLSALSGASDHNNVEAGRPLRFDDAYSIAFRERAFELGLSLETSRRRAPTYGAKAELKYGFAKNQDIAIAFEPHFVDTDRKFDAGNVELSYFHGLRREINEAPALGYRVDVGLPTGRNSKGVEVRLRGIATKALRQYDKVHLNLDLTMMSDVRPGERRSTLGAIVGYSSPLGYPKRFDQTVVAEFAIEQSKNRGDGYVGSVGIGLRRQIDPRSVFDVGITADVLSTKRSNRGQFRFAIGYSVGF